MNNILTRLCTSALAVSALSPHLAAQDHCCFTFVKDGAGGYCVFPGGSYINGPGVDLGMGDDTVAVVSSGFPICFPDGSVFTDITIDSNGRILPGSSGTSIFSPSVGGLINGSLPSLCPLWSDLNPGAGGSVSFLVTATAIVITWNDVPSFGSNNLNTFQAQIHLDGSVTFCYVELDSSLVSIVGVSAGNGAAAAQMDLTAAPFCTISTPTVYEPFGPPQNNAIDLLSCISNVCSHTIRAGFDDAFGTTRPIGSTEVACPRSALLSFITGINPARDFDEFGSNKLFGETLDLPGDPIVSARLDICVLPLASDAVNDSLALGFDGANFAYSVAFSTLFPNWPNGQPGVPFCASLDLANLPGPSGGTPGGPDILPFLMTQGQLDILVQDDTAVDAVELVIETTAPPGWQTDFELTIEDFDVDELATFNIANAPSSGPVVILIGGSLSAAAGLPGLCLNPPNFVTGFFADPSGSRSVSPFTVPSLPPCNAFSFQAVSLDSGGFVWSNTWTQRAY